MYKLTTFQESVRIPPNLFGLPLNKAALQILREQYERTMQKQHGIIVSLHNAKIKSDGKVIHGDGAAYYFRKEGGKRDEDSVQAQLDDRSAQAGKFKQKKLV